jgi:hypothetical protein
MTTTSNKEQIEEGTCQIIYKSYQDRNNQLSALNHAMVGFTVAFLAVMINSFSTVFINSGENREQLLFFIIFASIFELTLWRVYSNYVDLSIIDCYQNLICCEDILKISKDLSLREKIKKSRFLDRGHTIIDIFAYGIGIVICILFLGQFSNRFESDGLLYGIIFAFVFIPTAIWIIIIKKEKCKELNKCEKINCENK